MTARTWLRFTGTAPPRALRRSRTARHRSATVWRYPNLRPGYLPTPADMPKVSPGHTNELPNWLETWTGSESHPRVPEKARRYIAYPCGLLFESQATYAIPEPPPAT